MRTVRTAALTLLALFAVVPKADAGWKLERAQAIAEHVWDYDYGCNYVSIEWERPVDAFGAEMITEWRSQLSEPLMWTRPADPAPQRCAVFVNRDRVQKWGMSWGEVCSVMLHEYGHLAGEEHSADPHSIMYEAYLGQADRRCRKKGRPYMQRHDLF